MGEAKSIDRDASAMSILQISEMESTKEARMKVSGKVMKDAQNAVHKAIDNGELTPLPCEVCGTTDKVEAHHEDYSKVLEVMWLCRLHHKRRHKEIGHLVDMRDVLMIERFPHDLRRDLKIWASERMIPLRVLIIELISAAVAEHEKQH